MPILDVVVPQLGEGLREVLVQKLLRKPGEFVKRDDPIYVIETDKTDFEVESPYGGTLKEWLVEEGKVLLVGAIIARIEVTAGVVVVSSSPAQSAHISEATEEATAPPAAEQAGGSTRGPVAAQGRTNVFIPPRTRAYCRKLAISDEEISQIPTATGTLMPTDVDRYLTEKSESPPKCGVLPEATSFTKYGDRPLPAHQRLFNFRLKRSAQLVVPGTMIRKLDWQRFEAAVEGLQRHNPGVHSSDLETFAYAVAQASKDHPEFRSVLVGDDVVRQFDYLNLGIAVQRPGGELLTAVVPNADQLDFGSFVATAQLRITHALEGEDQVNEQVPLHLNYVSSLEITDGTPVLVAPAIGVVFLGAPTGPTQDRRANLGVTFDHRLINGVTAASFLGSIVGKVESFVSDDAVQPEKILPDQRPTWDSAFVSALRQAEPRERRLMLEKLLIEQVAGILEAAPAYINPREPLRALGLTSSMALELTTRLAASFELALPATLLWTYPTIADLAAYLAGQTSRPGVNTERPHRTSHKSALGSPTTLDDLERLSEEEAESLLKNQTEGKDEIA